MNGSDLFKAFLDALEGVLRGFAVKPDVPGAVSLQSDTLPTGYSQQDEETRQRLGVLRAARSMLGTPYKFGAEWEPGKINPAGIDCSELVERSYREGAGLTIPDGCVYQQAHCQRVNTPKEADLIFLGPNAKGIRHVLIVNGDGSVIHAKGGVGVVQEDMEPWVRHARFQGYYRIPEWSRPLEDRC